MINLKYSFKLSELKYINKFVFTNKLYGIPYNGFPCLKSKRSMIHAGILEKSKEFQITSLYSQLFQDWSNMKYVVTLPEQGKHKIDTNTILCNDKYIITVEENPSCIDVGYYFYEYYGYRDYLLKQLNLNFELKVKNDIDFCCSLNKEEFEKLMSYDMDFLKQLAQKTEIDSVILGGLATELSNANCKKVVTQNTQSGMKSEFLIYSNIAANFWCKKNYNINGDETYIIGITNTPRLLREIQMFE